MSRERRREMVDRQHPELATVRQCALMGISRSSLYYRPRGSSPEDLAIMKLLDQQYVPRSSMGRGKWWPGSRGKTNRWAGSGSSA